METDTTSTTAADTDRKDHWMIDPPQNLAEAGLDDDDHVDDDASQQTLEAFDDDGNDMIEDAIEADRSTNGIFADPSTDDDTDNDEALFDNLGDDDDEYVIDDADDTEDDPEPIAQLDDDLKTHANTGLNLGGRRNTFEISSTPPTTQRHKFFGALKRDLRAI